MGDVLLKIGLHRETNNENYKLAIYPRGEVVLRMYVVGNAKNFLTAHVYKYSYTRFEGKPLIVPEKENLFVEYNLK